MHPRPQFLRTLLLSVLAFALAACRPYSAGTKTDRETGSSEDAASRLIEKNLTYPTSDYIARAEGVPGGVLRASTALDVGSFDIHAVSHGNVQWLGRFLFDCLVYLDNEGNPTPWLAKSWAISPDGLVYTFRLREDVTFSDGTRFDAEAVRVNLDHMRDPATKSPLAGNYVAPIASTRIIDPFTIEVTLRAPYHPLLNVLAQSWLGMISPRQIRDDPKSIKERPIGSGPFTLVSYKVGERAVFRRRDDYRWAPDFIRHIGPAHLSGIELEFVPEAIVRFAALQSGQHHFTFDAPPQNAPALRARADFVFSSRVRQANPFRALSFNTTAAPFDDVVVRRAVALAIDRDAITRLVGFGEFIPKSDFLAVNTRYYDDSFRSILAYDPQAAERLLDEHGWTARDAEGFRVKDGTRLGAGLLVSENSSSSPVSVALQSDLKKIGFDLRIVQLPQGKITELRRDNKYQAIAGGYWHTNTPDGLYYLYHSRYIPSATTNGQNSARLADPVLDSVLQQAREATEDETRRALYREAQRLLAELVPAVPLHESHTVTAYSRDLQGVIFDTSHNTPILTGAWFSTATR